MFQGSRYTDAMFSLIQRIPAGFYILYTVRFTSFFEFNLYIQYLQSLILLYTKFG